MSDHRIRSNGVSLAVRDEGTGVPLLLLHGMWCRGSMFDRLLPHLRGYRIIIPDLRAHGDSDVPRAGWSLRDLARDCRTILETLETGPALVAGFSMGGMAALHLALKSPGLVRGLVLLGTSAEGENALRKAEMISLIGLIRLGLPRSRVGTEAARWMFSRAFREDHPDVAHAWSKDVAAMPRKALTQALEAVGRRPSLTRRLARLTLPASVGAGDKDVVLTPRHSKRLVRVLPGATLRILPGVGHALPIEAPEAVAGMIGELPALP